MMKPRVRFLAYHFQGKSDSPQIPHLHLARLLDSCPCHGRSLEAAGKLIIIEEERPRIPRRGWAEMIRKVYKVDPLTCSQCGGRMKVIAFLTDFSVVDRIINHLKLTFVAERPPPPRIVSQELLMAAETSAEYFP